ncbi:MAG: transporter [Bryobacteraceae bacterium]|nr:transporter [Bryobacteraceae bacterium]
MTWDASLVACSLTMAFAQDLAPRAYVITPTHSNAINLTYSYFDGGLNFNGTVPITDATGTYSVPVISYYHSFNFFGRSANATASLPYGVGTFEGDVLGTQAQVYRSGLMDTGYRVSVNLKGGPAMQVKDFLKWRQKVLLGVSLRVIAPSGQYDPFKLINWGMNRWAFKPEFGYSQRWDKWVLDGYAGVWFYTANDSAYAGATPAQQTLTPIGSFEGHLSRDFGKRRFWASLDGNFWFGGIASLNGVQNLATKQTSSRIGGTFSYPVNRRLSLKANYSVGSYVRFGGNYHTISFGWQYSWLGKP